MEDSERGECRRISKLFVKEKLLRGKTTKITRKTRIKTINTHKSWYIFYSCLYREFIYLEIYSL